MAKSFKLEVITPSKLFYIGDVEIIIVKTLEGEEGFMADHSWACKLLDVGQLWFREEGTQEFKVAAIAGGYIDVKDYVIIFTDAAEWPEDIDVARAKLEKEKAENWLKTPSESDSEIERAKIAIEKSLTRINVKEGGGRFKRFR